MTDYFPLKPSSELQLAAPSTTVLAPLAPAVANGFSPALDHVDDDDEPSTIKCICGFNDDDGNTVFCEECSTWQHIECYYPRAHGADASDVPDVHECTDCKPRDLDANGARDRQAQQRLQLTSKPKRGLNKGQKRRVKDPLQPNGWRAGPDSVDRNSGSPRDQPPPAKRPKTNHKSSSSNSVNQVMAHRKRRTGSTVTGRSPAKRPPSPLYQFPYFSPDFMQLHRKNDFTPIRANSYASIAVSNALSSWLTDPDSLAKDTGKTHHEIFQRWDRPIEELEATSPGFSQHSTEDLSTTLDGLHPIFRWITVDKDVGPGSYIGELKGQIGRKQDYSQEPVNRWPELRHPEPFVFFLDTLPVYIDSRVEGTSLRYVRRSCDPNVKIQIVVMGTEYHFCLVSTKGILAGEEISLGWTLVGRPFEIVRDWKHNRTMSEEDEAHICAWTAKVLANFGGCACGRSIACALARFDHRARPNAQLPMDKPAKGKRGKKFGSQISPLSTGKATNSRAGSEAINNGEIDEDVIDTRSVSASSRSKPTSRDNTPSIAGGIEMSDRERRKILQQERLFEQLEQEAQQGGRKKKRNSAGSTVNTPTVAASKQLGFPDGSNPSPTGAPTVMRSRANGVNAQVYRSAKATTNGAPAAPPRPKPVYVDSSMQTDDTEPTPKTAVDLAKLRRGRGSFAQRLFKRAEEERRRRARLVAERKNSLASSSPASSKGESTSAKDAATAMPPPPLPRARSPSPRPPAPSKVEEMENVDMVDDNHVESEPAAAPTANQVDAPIQTNHEEALSSDSPSQQPNPPPPPWPASEPPGPPADGPAPSEKGSPSRTPDLHVQLPPPPTFPAPSLQTPTTPSASGPILGNVVALSPSTVTNPSIFSPSVTANVQLSSPAKMVKRTSLGDYMARMRQKEKTAAATAATESSNTTSSPIDKPPSSGPPSLPASSSTAIEDTDMPLAPPRSQDPKEKENLLDPSMAAAVP